MRHEIKIYERYMFHDPAGKKHRQDGKRKSKAATIVIGVDFFDNIVVLSAWGSNDPIEKKHQRILADYVKWQPEWIGVEKVALQEELMDVFVDYGKRHNVHVRAIPVTPPAQMDKDYRIVQGIRPTMEDRRLFIPAEFIELRHELTVHPTGLTKDQADALAHVIRIHPPRANSRNKKTGALSYLVDCGVSPQEARKMIIEYKKEYQEPKVPEKQARFGLHR